MAYFGAPFSDEQHASNALREQKGEPALRIGISIHRGDAVMGNIGSANMRLDYTAIGDTVNPASRLESLKKYRM